MENTTHGSGHGHDTAPGDEHEVGIAAGIRGYLFGFVIAALMTVASFYVAKSDLIWLPGIPIALSVLAIAQMGIHLVFFLHISTDPDNTNNILALAFGVLIVGLVVSGSVWIMSNLNHNMESMSHMMQMQR